MCNKARENNLIFRPHFKTHQSKEVGDWYRDFGVNKITVSSVAMGVQFIESGWNDITIAFPFNIREINRINSISKDVILNLTIENITAVRSLKKELIRPVGIFIKIDTGYKRTGVFHDNTEEITSLLDFITPSDKIFFKGFLIHAGHTYNCKSKEEVIQIHQDSLQKIRTLKKNFISNYPDLIISYGDTPSCSLAVNFENIDEIRPGNFVFYDLMQYHIGSCSLDEIAVSVACPVVAKHPSRNQIVIHGGAVHFSKESAIQNNQKYFGLKTSLNNTYGRTKPTQGKIIGLSQEHGILEINDQDEFENTNIGDLVFILPVHSCLTTNLFRSPMLII